MIVRQATFSLCPKTPLSHPLSPVAVPTTPLCCAVLRLPLSALLLMSHTQSSWTPLSCTCRSSAHATQISGFSVARTPCRPAAVFTPPLWILS